jgi:hypothetical protein
MLAFSLAALSLAKGYEILKRNRSLSTVLLPERAARPGRIDHYRIDELNRKMTELMRGRDGLMEENSQLKSQINRFPSELNSLTQVEHLLRKSNIALSKECERLRSENETLTLKANAPVIKAKRSRPKAKIKTKTSSRPKKKRKRAKR